MSVQDTSTINDAGQILAVAQQIFSALIDDGESLVVETEAAPDPASPITAWVDITTPGVPGGVRAALATERTSADALVRALLRMGAASVVTEEDLTDAFGEIANVVGGNLKSLLPAHADLSLPVVVAGTSEPHGTRLVQVPLDWRGRCLVVSLWDLAPAPSLPRS